MTRQTAASAARDLAVVQARQGGMSTADAAKHFKISEARVYQIYPVAKASNKPSKPVRPKAKDQGEAAPARLIDARMERQAIKKLNPQMSFNAARATSAQPYIAAIGSRVVDHHQGV